MKVVLYFRPGCHLCEQVEAWLEELRPLYPCTVERIDIEADEALQEAFGERIPVLEVGPYTLEAPIERQRLAVTLGAAQDREAHIARADEAVYQARVRQKNRLTRSNRAVYWFSRHYLLVFNVFFALYVGLPFLAPALMEAGIQRPAGWIYRAYSVTCHQLAFRSWFLFGEQPAYPRAAARVEGWKSYEEAINPDSDDLWTARRFVGNPQVGYKVAFCERDVAIYLGILLFGLLFGATRRRLPALPWYLWILLGMVPVGLDGVSQIISQLPFESIHAVLPYRESTPLLRTLTGFLFGFSTAWFGYPLVEEAMQDTRALLESKFARLEDALSAAERHHQSTAP